MSSGFPDRRITRSLASLLELGNEFGESQINLIESDLVVTDTEETRQVRPRKKRSPKGNQRRRTPTIPLPIDFVPIAQEKEEEEKVAVGVQQAAVPADLLVPERNMPGSYTNWSERPTVHPHQWNDWASYSDKNQILRDVRKVRFAIAESRNQGLEALIVCLQFRWSDQPCVSRIPGCISMWTRHNLRACGTDCVVCWVIRTLGRRPQEALWSLQLRRLRRIMIVRGAFRQRWRR